MDRPDYLSQGEAARLFPVLSNTSKEGRTTSILLACVSKIDEFAVGLMRTVGQRVGVRTKVTCFTEIVFKDQKTEVKDRPDGLIVLKTGSREWRALVEAKVGSNPLSAEQIERYRALAKEHAIDCVITISNQFATSPEHHPSEDVRKSRSKVPVFHWSWMSLLTAADLLLSNDGVEDQDQAVLLKELKRFLSHESAGIKGFDRMPPEWSELNKLVAVGGKIPAKSEVAFSSISAWHQEIRDLSLILSRQTETQVRTKLSRKHSGDPAARMKDDLTTLRETQCMQVVFDIPDAAAPLEVKADLMRRTIEVGMVLKAPEDRKSSKARLNWLLRQVDAENTSDLHVECRWPGRSEATPFLWQDLLADPSICEDGKKNLQVIGFRVFYAVRLGARFTQQANFVSDLERVVPEFYRKVGQDLVAWRKPAPRIKEQSDADLSADDEITTLS